MLKAELKKLKDRADEIDNILAEKDDAGLEDELKKIRESTREQRKRIKTYEEKKEEYITLSKQVNDLTVEINIKLDMADTLDGKLCEKDDSDLEDELQDIRDEIRDMRKK